MYLTQNTLIFYFVTKNPMKILFMGLRLILKKLH